MGEIKKRNQKSQIKKKETVKNVEVMVKVGERDKRLKTGFSCPHPPLKRVQEEEREMSTR